MRTMIAMILNRLFGSEMSVQRANEKDLKMAGEVELCVEKQPEKKLYDDPDLNILAEKYGELVAGKEIMIELGEAAKMLGRKRVRLDAFAALTKKLKIDYGVELKIYSRRTKLEQKGDDNVH